VYSGFAISVAELPLLHNGAKWNNSWSLLQRQKRIVIYYIKKFVKESQ
jgi:hypothetical protein